MKWDIVSITAEASKHKNRRAFHRAAPGAYKAALRLGMLDTLFKNLGLVYWTDDMLAAEAKKYSGRGAFAKGSPSAYVTARKRKLLDSICPPRQLMPWSERELRQAVSTHATRTEFARAEPAAYSFAQRRGMLDAICPEPTLNYWTEGNLAVELSKYASRTEVQDKANGAYSAAVRMNLLHLLPPVQGGTSRQEKEILAYLQSLHADFVPKSFYPDYRLDCYSDSLKLGVEYNGFYWHSEDQKGRLYHLKKTKYFEALGIRVIHVWENEWRDRRAQVQNYLQSACGMNKAYIGARKCQFLEIDTKVAKQFLSDQHIQGAPGPCQMALGAYHGGVLVSAATFGLHHRNTGEIVLNRFACLQGHTVLGGLSKFSKMAYDMFGPLKSWADYSKSQGRGYLAAGWELVSSLRPDYFYADASGEVVTKQSRCKGAVGTPEGVTESEHAKADGLYRIWDCGKLVLTYKKTS